MTALSIFDMDRTITRTGTYTPWLMFWARRAAPWRLALLPLAAVAMLAYALKLISRGRLKEINQAMLMGRPRRPRVEAMAAAFAARVIDRNVFAGARTRLAAERAEGRRIVLATASYDFYARAIAGALSIVDVVATRSEWNGDRLLPRIDGENCYGAAKLRMVEDWLAEQGLGDAPIRFFSDHVSDLPMFERAAERVATTPSPRLRAVARARGWEIVDWT